MEFAAIPPSVPSGHLPLKGGDWTAFVAAFRVTPAFLLTRFTVGGNERRGALPISPLEGEMSAKLTEGGANRERRMIRGRTDVH